MFKVKVYVTLKQDVLDPQGQAVRGALLTLGYDETESVRIGKYIEIMINTEQYEVAQERIKEMCEKLLANTVIEEYRYELEEVAV
ncbi:phosphoribosylformylglycinamidine synthase subunit PurS [Tepidibacillus infernus]|uniref:Phosphoribosylformylglycinamidine synthase subunit PurS n=1 Tax=Tepidibacillus decaturensis TaxID=1413211 RepID=A0A135L113_9BACI|nr:phosphoribosylformylglycinamidine synthase subunit PurS [Tepidibacillus decaturensis]KXG42609.1 phosphoribosylformylglycinamidine synthase [Tepidibacillus decaturensis]